MANFLSRLHTPNDPNPIVDNFPKEHLFAITTKAPWSADIANYLSFGKFPTQFTNKQNKRSLEKDLDIAR